MFSKKFSYLLLCKMNRRLLSGAQVLSSNFKEQKVKVRNYMINYLRVGEGPHLVFCAPGHFGSIWADFKEQIEGFDLEKFSLLLWDPPGYGKSVAIDNDETLGVYSRDADIAYEFLKALEVPKLSLMGWSYGGLISLLIASRHEDMVNKVVAWGCGTFTFKHELEYYKNLINLNNWPDSQKEQMIKLYGEENFKKKIAGCIMSMVALYDSKVTFCGEVKHVKCPTFLLRGSKDSVVDVWHMNNLQNLIRNCRTHVYPEGKHNIHKKYADDFNKRVQEFLLETI